MHSDSVERRGQSVSPRPGPATLSLPQVKVPTLLHIETPWVWTTVPQPSYARSSVRGADGRVQENKTAQ